MLWIWSEAKPQTIETSSVYLVHFQFLVPGTDRGIGIPLKRLARHKIKLKWNWNRTNPRTMLTIRSTLNQETHYRMTFSWDMSIVKCKVKYSKSDIAVRNRTSPHRYSKSHAIWDRTRSGDFPAVTPAEAVARFNGLGGLQGWVDLGGGYIPR